MKDIGIVYLRYTKENHDREYPAEGELGEEVFRGQVIRETYHAEDIKAGWQMFMEQKKKEGWKLYTWSALIKDGIVIRGIGAYDKADERHQYGYDIKTVITEVADNAQIGWFE